MPIVLALVLALLALFGSTTANAATPANAEIQQVEAKPVGGVDVSAPLFPAEAPESIACYEDMPCWDCSTMGNKQCGPVAHEADAYLAFDALGGVPVGDESLMLEYVSSFTTDLPELESGQFVLDSTQTDGLHHVMQWTSVQSC
jgi:hypothetical protein